jgi:hypothetical protein
LVNNDALTDVSSLAYLDYISNSLFIYENELLSDCCAFYHLIDEDGTRPWSIQIRDNGGGCNSPEEIAEGCHIAEYQVIRLQGLLEEFVSGEQLESDDAQKLQNKLDLVLAMLDDDNLQDAIGMLGAAINQVNALVNSGKLTPEDGQALIDATQEIIDQLNSP